VRACILLARCATAAVAALAIGVVSAPVALAHESASGIRIKESEHRVKAIGDGFVLKLTKHAIDVRVDEDDFGDPSTGNPIQRQTINLTGLTLRPFECANGTYTIRTGTFDRTIRVSRFERRPPPYTPEFATGSPGIFTPFVGVLDGTVTDANGETLRFLISDLVHEELTADGFTSTAPIHGLFVDQRGRVRDRISLIGRFRSGPGGENARYFIEDRGTCRQIVDLPYGPGSARSVVTGPLFVLPFSAPVKDLSRD
jgi:hypothetical protein